MSLFTIQHKIVVKYKFIDKWKFIQIDGLLFRWNVVYRKKWLTWQGNCITERPIRRTKADIHLVSIIQTHRPWTPRRTSGRIVNKKNWRESEAYRNFGKRFDWSLAIKRHIVMASPLAVTAPSSVHHQDDSMVSRGVLMIETNIHCIYLPSVLILLTT